MRTRHDADPALIEQPPTAAATTDHDHERDNALALLQNQQSNQLDQRADDSDVTSHELPDLNVSLPPQDDDNDNALEELLDLNESPQDDDGDDNVKGMPTLDDRSLPQGNDKNSPSCAVQMQPVYQPELGIYGTGTYLMTSQAEDTCTSPQEDNDKFCVPDLNL
ncbi:hypothetical protein BCR37DRAFT_391611 [Protomyces lactucae-debilis]|uniref:Uncharacterized protein n=1 Tax=Protomyces lactucae-debilis TaxID=2754530 RepID=A0A1Y2FLK6_PROLT|nr:uncharacterized protein BCR37DRAFT_391611 [Protomyces lactucae-debilis]ORY84853.1 hypothetical protein BCR37DRAFT_391611 [Protomyces lactucae-debilis]